GGESVRKRDKRFLNAGISPVSQKSLTSLRMFCQRASDPARQAAASPPVLPTNIPPRISETDRGTGREPEGLPPHERAEFGPPPCLRQGVAQPQEQDRQNRADPALQKALGHKRPPNVAQWRSHQLHDFNFVMPRPKTEANDDRDRHGRRHSHE